MYKNLTTAFITFSSCKSANTVKNVDSSIFRVAENVNINLLLGYEINGHKVDFNEKYENDNPFY